MMKDAAKKIIFSTAFAVVPLILGILVYNVLFRGGPVETPPVAVESVESTEVAEEENVSPPEETPQIAPPVAIAAPPQGPINTNIFVDLAKKVVPSVVNISTLTNVSGFGGGEDPFSEFWDFFFRGQPPGPGGPGRRMPPGRQPPRERKKSSLGTGFIIDSSGLILTNNHVIAGADEVKIRFTEEETEKPVTAEVVGQDEELDLAVVKVKTKRKLVPMALGNSDTLQVGEYVVAVGNPFGRGHSVTHGIISAKGRDAPDFPLARYLQTDAPINPGNSGGPLVNLRGEVIGINNAIDARAQGIGFAIPINLVKAVLPQLKDKGKVSRGYIGVSISPLRPEIAEQLGLDKDLKAVFVEQVFPGKAADRAGMKPYDVIVEVNGEKVQTTSQLIKRIAGVAVGKSAKVKVLRGKKSKNLTVTVEERPPRNVLAGRAPPRKNKKSGPKKKANVDVGMELETLSAATAKEIGFKPGTQGVLVRALGYDGPGAKAGFSRGDVIVEVDRKKVTDVDQFYSLVDSKKSYLIRVMRLGPNGDPLFRVVVLDLK